MKVFWDIDKILPRTDSVITVGTFDGVHCGHQQIIRQVIEHAARLEAVSTLMTFEPHPVLVVRRGKEGPSPYFLTTIDEKIELLSKTGLDRLVIVNFTTTFASLSAEQFVRDKLIAGLGMKHIIIGHDHTFGRNRAGNVELLREMSEEARFGITDVDPVKCGGHVVSSTLVRNTLLDGEIEKAAELLRRPYSIVGQVVRGTGRGRRLGYPTANIRPQSQYKLMPKVGIYASRLKMGGDFFDSVTYIGYRPTFNLSQKVLETHIFDSSGDFYNENVEVFLYRFIREDRKFASDKELMSQIDMDKEHSQELLKQL
jgi:riboflavin kinase/FMN adenylyltransferase